MNRENLKKLADGLRGELAVEFHMGRFVDGVEDDEQVAVIGRGCGTSACAVGHATYLVAPKIAGECFFRYSERLFGLEPNENWGEWDWCFSSAWGENDNTANGVADRIEWLLDHGVPTIREVTDMMCGDAPLCYRTAP